MPTLNAAATLEQAQDFASNWASSTIEFFDGATSLATHTITSWTASNSGQNGRATSAAIPVDQIDANGTCDNVTITKGTKTITLQVGSDITITPNNFISGQDNTVNPIVITFPAS